VGHCCNTGGPAILEKHYTANCAMKTGMSGLLGE
jgi:hypothetical protein